MVYLHRFQPSRSNDFNEITIDIANQIIQEAVSIPQVNNLLFHNNFF